MSNFLGADRITRERQKVFIGTREVPGIISVQASYQNNYFPLKFLGSSIASGVPEGVQQGQVSINSLIITNDYFLSYTGTSGFNGYIVKVSGNPLDNISFSSGYLTSYTSRCSIGQIPETNVSISVLGNLGRLPTGYTPQILNDLQNLDFTFPYQLKIASPNSINITMDEFNTNRVLSYDLQINVPRLPVYALGTEFPIAVNINWPLEVTLGFKIDVNDYVAKTFRDFPYSQTIKNISLSINDYSGNAVITSFGFNNMNLIGESFSFDSNSNNVIADLSYRCYIGKD